MSERFTKKPVTVEAIQWTGDNLAEVIAFTGRHPRFDEWFSTWEEYAQHVARDRRVVKIFTLEGTHEANVGDWIIRGVKGEHYPCKPDIFAETYRPASEAIHPAPQEFSAEQIAADPILRFFHYAHLPPALRERSSPFCDLAYRIIATTPRNAERTVALRKLLEAKDAAVRAALP